MFNQCNFNTHSETETLVDLSAETLYFYLANPQLQNFGFYPYAALHVQLPRHLRAFLPSSRLRASALREEKILTKERPRKRAKKQSCRNAVDA